MNPDQRIADATQQLVDNARKIEHVTRRPATVENLADFAEGTNRHGWQSGGPEASAGQGPEIYQLTPEELDQALRRALSELGIAQNPGDGATP